MTYSPLAIISSFKYPLIILLACIILSGYLGGLEQAIIVSVLAVLEISLSFDNAVINATVVKRLSAFWQKMFMTVGIFIAVVGMRILFPVLIVAVTAGIGFGEVVNLIFNNPTEYGHKLELAHPSIAAFGGMFLFMIFLDFLLDEAKKIHWLAIIEKPLAEGGRLKTLSSLLALIALMVVAATWGKEHAQAVMSAGVLGLATYLGVRGFSQLFERLSGAADVAKSIVPLTGKAAFFMFLYLEVLDASFSFDGVVGAFAITNNVLTIAIGLGVGAIFVRELTVWLVRHNTLDQFVFLEHGAHYAVGILAILLAASLSYEIPEVITGLTGVAFIVAALVSSVRHRRKQPPAIKA